MSKKLFKRLTTKRDLLYIFAYSFLFLLIASSLILSYHPKEQHLSYYTPRGYYVSELLSLTNAERAKVGAKPLRIDNRLNESAQAKVDDMDKDGYFGHADPVTGMHGYGYMTEYGITCVSGGENLFNGEPIIGDTRLAVYGWMHSTVHRELMLAADTEYVGFGVSGKNVAQHLCKT